MDDLNLGKESPDFSLPGDDEDQSRTFDQPPELGEVVDTADTHLQRLEATLKNLKSIKSTYPADERVRSGALLNLLESFTREVTVLEERLSDALGDVGDVLDEYMTDGESDDLPPLRNLTI